MSVSIVAQVSDLCKTHSLMTYGTTLAIGQDYELALAQHLTDLGYPTYQPKQQMIESYRLQKYKQTGRDRWLTETRRLYRTHQIDLMMKLDQVRRLIIEVKALTGAAFRKKDIHIGLAAKYDEKVPPVGAVMLINQDTGEIFVCPPKRKWWVTASIYDYHQTDYVVSRADLISLEDWLKTLA